MYKWILIVFSLLLSSIALCQERPSAAPSSSAPARFGISDVIDLLQAKVPEEIIIGQIVRAQRTFALSTPELIALTKAGASERVIRQLDPSIASSKPAGDSAVTVAAPPAPAGPAAKPEARAAADPNDPDAPHKPGIYLYTEKNGERKMVEISKTVPQSSRTKDTPVVSIVKGAYVYAFLPREKALIRTPAHQPIFYFYVGETSQISSAVDSPGQLALVRMEHQLMQNLEGRRMAYAKVPHAFSPMIIGTDPKAVRLFKSEQTGPLAFRLITDSELEAGEYCFFFNTGASVAKGAAAANVTLWDFGID